MTEAVRDRRGYGDQVWSADILPEGVEVIRLLSQKLKGEKINSWVASPVKRCRQTAEIVKEEVEGVEFKFDERLREFHDECLDDLVGRVDSFLSFCRRGGERRMAVCTHGAVMGALKRRWGGEKLGTEQLLDYPLPGVLWRFEGEEFEVQDFNKD